MSRFRIWRHDTETAFADVEAQDEEHAFRLVEEGDDQLVWTGARYNAEYEVDKLANSFGATVTEVEFCNCTNEELEAGRICARPECPNRNPT